MARIAMLLGNPCNPDYRVIKEAEALAALGHDVRVFCKSKAGLADLEARNGVTYQRLALGSSVSAVVRTHPASRASRQTPRSTTQPLGYTGHFWNDVCFTLHRAEQRCLTELRRVRRPFKFTAWPAPAMLIAARKRAQKITKFHRYAQDFLPVVTAWKPEIVHAHDLSCLPAGLKASRACGARLIYDSHELETHRNPPLPGWQRLAYGWIERHAIRRAHGVITVCEPIADHLAKAYGIRRPDVLLNAPVVEPRSGTTPGRMSIREQAAVRAGTKLGVYVGLITMNRGIETLLQAVADMDDVAIVAVGPKNPAYALTIEETIKRMGLAGKFIILPPVPPEELVDYIAGADFGVNPLLPVTLSYQYAMPNKLFEMAFAGLPIINSDAQESAKFVCEHNLGVIFRAGDAQSCRAAIAQVAADTVRHRPSAEHVAALRQAYGWHRQAEKLGALYRRILADSTVSSARNPSWVARLALGRS